MERYVAHVMGTAASLALRGTHESDAAAHRAWAEVVAELRWADLVFSTYRPDSAVSRLGRGEIELADCPAEVAEVLAIGEGASAATDGAFSCFLPDGDGVLLDPSGVVKGWSADRATRALADLSGTDWALSVGGDVRCRSVTDAGPWRIGIEDPADPRGIIAVVPVQDGAVATSGAAWRGAHLLDARTGRPADAWAQVSVIADDLLTADLDATCAAALGHPGPGWLAARGRSYVVVGHDGAVTTPGPAGSASSPARPRSSSSISASGSTSQEPVTA